MKLLTRAMVAASAVSMVASTSAKADSPDIGLVGSSFVLTALSTGTMTITFLHARAEFTNNLVLFTSSGTGGLGGTAAPTGGTTYTNPLISVPGAYDDVGVGNPLTINISVTAGQVLLFGICSSGNTGGANTACGAGFGAYYMGQASNNNDGSLHAVILTAAEWNIAATTGPTPCFPDDPFGPTNCYLAAAGTTVVGFEDLPNLGDADFNDLVFSFTNVSTVPEPGTMGLLALGLVGLSGAGLVRRRSRNK